MQTSIKSYFKPHKGPLMFDANVPLPKNQTKARKRCSRKKKGKLATELEDNDVEFVVEIKENVKIEPLSPKIIFEHKFNDGDVNFQCSASSSQDDNENGAGSPSKKFKQNPQNPFKNTQVANIAITKSSLQIKKDSKTSRTQQINNCHEARMSCTLSSQNIEKIAYSQTLQEIIEMEIKPDITDFIIASNDDKSEIIDRIRNHISMVNTLLKNSTRQNFENLLFEDERQLLVSFCSMNIIYQYVCCKLFTHQVKWYNINNFLSSIQVPLLEDKITDMVNILEDQGLVATDYSQEELVKLLNLLYADDVKKIYNNLKIKSKARSKPNFIEVILKYVNTQPTLNPLKTMDIIVKKMVCEKLGVMFKVSPNLYKTLYKVHLLYSFTNPDLDIPAGLYRFMGEMKYERKHLPTYTISDDVIFNSPDEFDKFYKACSYKEELFQEFDKKTKNLENILNLCNEIYEELERIVDNKNVTSDIKCGFLNRYTPGTKYTSALAFAADKLAATYPSHVKLWLDLILVQKYFCVRKRSFMYAQLAIIYKKHYKDERKACQILLSGLKDNNLQKTDVCELIYRTKSYMKNNGNKDVFDEVKHLFKETPNPEAFPTVVIDALSVNSNEPVYIYRNASDEIEYLRVEEVAIRHYVDYKGFRQGIHCEGSLMSALFFIFFWDIIFKEGIPNTFISPLQLVPLDFRSPDFYNNRNMAIDRRLNDIKNDWSEEELKSYVLQTWTLASSVKFLVSRFLNSDSHILELVGVLTRPIVADLCKRLAKNYDECHAGMPDLFLWNNTKCKFVEVKGPGDKLSTKQKLWIEYLLKVGAEVEVCHVRRIGSRK